MRKFIYHWYDLNLIIGIILIILLILQQINLNFTQRLLCLEFAFINLHFWEEYRLPGDRPGTINVALYKNHQSPTRYPFNMLSAMICNDLFAFIIWFLPIFGSQSTWLPLSVIIWSFIDFGAHVFYYPHKMHATFNGGFFTSLIGFLPL